jgi:Ni/Fe-hydrogenase subunit HybB-like protein
VPPVATAAFSPARPLGEMAADLPLARGGWGRWWLALAGSLALCGLLAVSLVFLFWQGVGIWGNNVPVTWALDIVSYDWWIGIACGGLLVSGLFLLLDVEWRGAINRIAETMALLAAAAAAVYPIIHLGRPWFFYWNLPYFNTFALWPQFRSPLFWDAVDILAFLGIAGAFWFTGLLPDLANLRDRAFARVGADGKGLLRAQLYGIAALGWRGSAVHWHRWTHAYRILAWLGLLVVISLQTGAAVMFAGTAEPGWHDTLLPIEFLTGAVLSGVGMLTALTMVLRSAFRLHALITLRHFEVLAWLMLGLGVAMLYCESASVFSVLAGHDPADHANLARRFSGPHAWAWWMMIAGALLPVHLLWFGACRRSPLTLALVGLCAAAGIWGDHFTVIVVTLQRDFMPSSSHGYSIDFWELATFAGSAGLFLFLLLMFLRLLPVVSLVETREARAAVVAGQAAPHWPPLAPDATHWAVGAEFADPPGLVAAVRLLRSRHLRRIETYTPVPYQEIDEALGLSSHALRVVAVLGFVIGGGAMFGMCTYATAYDYVFDIGGRPRFSWPSFVVPSVSCGLLFAGLATFLAMISANRLPRLNHPAFNIPGFLGASRNRLFAVVAAHEDDIDPAVIEQAFADLDCKPLAGGRVPR